MIFFFSLSIFEIDMNSLICIWFCSHTYILSYRDVCYKEVRLQPSARDKNEIVLLTFLSFFNATISYVTR